MKTYLDETVKAPPSMTVGTTRLEKKRRTKEYPEKRSGVSE